MISSVSWTGLTHMIMDLKAGMPKRMLREVNEYTKDIMNITHQLYVENLSGGGPRSAHSGLPVGVRTGALRAGAEKRQINQYACEVFNNVHYAGFIEDGTRKMPPRRPLGDAVQKVEGMVPGRMGQVVTVVIITE